MVISSEDDCNALMKKSEKGFDVRNPEKESSEQM
jgi:hypothetical protein